MANFLESASFEHQFWLQVFGDHAKFIRDSLYPKEKDDIEKAKQMATLFDRLLERSKTLNANNAIAFTKEAESAAEQIKQFKLSIIRRHLTGNISIHLPPTFLNHMVNELEEYELVLTYLKQGEVPPIFHELHHHLVWLVDASGHAGAINNELDGVEKRLKQKSAKFAKHFDNFYLKAIELTGYMRANIDAFPALDKFNKDVEVEIHLFRSFLHEIEELELSEALLSTFSATMADHMAREESYYLTKLAEAQKARPPDQMKSKSRTSTIE